MPRFAANLGSNPLQPIKQTAGHSAPEQPSERKSSIGNEPTATASPPNKDYDWDNGSNLASTDFQACKYFFVCDKLNIIMEYVFVHFIFISAN